MTDVADAKTVSSFLDNVRQGIAAQLGRLELPDGRIAMPPNLMPGKMLRSRFGARMGCHAETAGSTALELACVATEILHTATLCHDDVIDNGLVRRSAPSLWKVTGPSAAVLIGDWLLCESVQIVKDIDRGAWLGAFLAKVQETCRAESEHEMSVGAPRLDADTCIRLARGKAGALFSFVGLVAGAGDAELSAGMEEAGYCMGTAYQLADDLLDAVGSEKKAGKTLGTDAVRRKFTLPQDPHSGRTLARQHIAAQCRRALEAVARWEDVRIGLESFLYEDLRPLFASLGGSWGTTLKEASG
jgi:heptaprenyl diphosphate synthase